MTVLKRIQTENGLRDIYYKKTPKGTWVSDSGRVYFVKRKSSSSAQEVTEDDIIAPMSGAIIAVEVSPGDSVKEGQDLVIMSAMKMEYRLKAPKDGIIKTVKCSLDDLVDIDDLLVSMEK